MKLEVVVVRGEVRVCARGYWWTCCWGWTRKLQIWSGLGLISHQQQCCTTHALNKYVNNIRKWRRKESRKVRERVRVKIRAVVKDNLGLGIDVIGMNRMGVAW